MSENNIEIERKFLIEKIPFDLSNVRHSCIKQGYISTDPTIRIRQKDDKYIFTFKGKGKIMKIEFENELTEAQFNNLMKKVETKIIAKERYFIDLEDGLTAELDIYEGELSGFMNVEVEFSSMEEAEAFTAPDWFGEDVSYDRRYSNANLSINGIPAKK